MKLQPIWKSAAFWSTVVGAIVAVVAGLQYNAEAEMIGAVSALIIGYLVSRGIVAKATAEAQAKYAQKGELGTDEEPGDVNF